LARRRALLATVTDRQYPSGTLREVMMPTFGVWEWVIILMIFFIFFGAGKLGNLGGAVRRGIDNFKQGAGIDDDKKAEKKPLKPS
jgi:sec-independent protein translocase protein TatA